MKQLYRFQIQNELSPGVFSAVDEASDSSIQLVQVPLDPAHRDSQMVELRRIAAERGCEDFSAGPNFYLVATAPSSVGDLRQTLSARGFKMPFAPPLPPPLPPPPSRPTPWNWIVGISLVVLITVAVATNLTGRSAGPTPTPAPDSGQSSPPSPQPSESLQQLNQGTADFNAGRYKTARASFNASCTAGNANACGYLALLYAKGLGGPFDLAKAKQLYSGSCDQGDTHSCMSLGYIYRSGNQPRESLAFFKKACAGHMQDGCIQAQRVK